MPSSWAVVMTSTQAAAGSLPLVSTQRTSSSRISAAVPGSESTPASRAAVSHSRTDMPVREAPFMTSIGEKACTCMPGVRPLDLGREVEVRGAGQVGVDAALHAHLGGAGLPGLLRPVRHLGQGQGVGIGVGAALRERAEPAARCSRRW